MKKVCILGGGVIGTYLHNHLRKFYHTALFRQIQVDYTHQKALERLLTSHSFDVIVNCCGFTGVPNVDQCEVEKEKCFELNVSFPLMLASTAKQFGIPVVHITTGCIYDNTNLEKEYQYDENDRPNFGIWSDRSSYYSKCKHISQENLMHFPDNVLLRIRIPFFETDHPKNFITKIQQFDRLMDRNGNQTGFRNSKTCLQDLALFTQEILKYDKFNLTAQNIYNVVNENPLNTREIIDIMSDYGLNNTNWEFIDYHNLNLKTNRSNCILSNSFPELKLRTEEQALRECCEAIVNVRK